MAAQKTSSKATAASGKQAPVKASAPATKAPATPAKTTKPAAKAAPAKPEKAAVKPAAQPAVKKPVAAVKGDDTMTKKKVDTKAEPATLEPKAAEKPVKKAKPADAEKHEDTEAAPAAEAKGKSAAKKDEAGAKKSAAKSSIKYDPDFTRSVLDPNFKPVEPTNSANRYTDSELVEFRELINRKLESAKKELAYLQGVITRKDDTGGDNEARYMTMEDGSLSMEREQVSQMASRQITYIDHLEKALIRIENKTYGICRVTGKLIDKARLRAVPHATLSVEAKMGKTKA